MTYFPKYVTKYHSCRRRLEWGGEGERGWCRGGRGAAGRLAGVPGRGGGRGLGAGGGEAACREHPRAGRERGARAPAGAGRGREEPRAAAASAGGAAGPPHSPPAPPPRSLALTPGRRRRAARAPLAPHGRPRNGALRPCVVAQPGPARHAEPVCCAFPDPAPLPATRAPPPAAVCLRCAGGLPPQPPPLASQAEAEAE
ncbi:Synaptojanin-1 [Manis pentadactyla]|nr:Synaptojanin-1 [Manis pentadactyla]